MDQINFLKVNDIILIALPQHIQKMETIFPVNPIFLDMVWLTESINNHKEYNIIVPLIVQLTVSPIIMQIMRHLLPMNLWNLQNILTDQIQISISKIKDSTISVKNISIQIFNKTNLISTSQTLSSTKPLPTSMILYQMKIAKIIQNISLIRKSTTWNPLHKAQTSLIILNFPSESNKMIS